MEAGAGKAHLGGIEDVLAARTLRVGLELGHGVIPGINEWCLRVSLGHETKRMIVLFARDWGRVKATGNRKCNEL
jgi:hypothetical protein